LESIAETQPQLQPALLSLSAMISQYFHQSSRADLSHRTRVMLNSGKEEGEDASEEDD